MSNPKYTGATYVSADPNLVETVASLQQRVNKLEQSDAEKQKAIMSLENQVGRHDMFFTYGQRLKTFRDWFDRNTPFQWKHIFKSEGKHFKITLSDKEQKKLFAALKSKPKHEAAYLNCFDKDKQFLTIKDLEKLRRFQDDRNNLVHPTPRFQKDCVDYVADPDLKIALKRMDIFLGTEKEVPGDVSDKSPSPTLAGPSRKHK